MTKVAEVKAQALDPDEHTAWFAGKVPRRLLAIPFGGPIPRPGAPRGVDYDNEFFSDRTDIYGGVRALKQTRERLTDFSHSYAAPDARYGDPTGMMTGHVIGKSILDPNPDEDGWWVDFWFNLGDKRVRMIEALAARGRQLFGSSQPVPGKAQRNPDGSGEITVWPFMLETLTPAPSNTHSAFLPAKSMLEEADLTGIAISAQMRSLLAGMRDLDADLRRSSLTGDDGAKAGRELSSANDQEIEAMQEEIATALAGIGSVNTQLANFLERTRARYRKEPGGVVNPPSC